VLIQTTTKLSDMPPLLTAIRLVEGGTQAALAAAINRLRPDAPKLGQSAISNWLQRGRVPADQVLAIAQAVDYRVTPHEIRPDLYPNPEDGLPPHRRLFAFIANFADVLTPAERATLTNAVLLGPQAAIEVIEALDKDLTTRAQLLSAAAGKAGVERIAA
jgi:DNA-binding transcriptional regulator YdaS (Cro superfamily)